MISNISFGKLIIEKPSGNSCNEDYERLTSSIEVEDESYNTFDKLGEANINVKISPGGKNLTNIELFDKKSNQRLMGTQDALKMGGHIQDQSTIKKAYGLGIKVLSSRVNDYKTKLDSIHKISDIG